VPPIVDISGVTIHNLPGVKLSNKGRYAVRAVFDIAFHSEGRATQIKDIARRQGIPPRFLEQIFQDLKRSGLVTSKRGPRGGYALSRPPGEITLGDVVRAVEGPIDLSSGREPSVARDTASRAVTERVFGELAERMEACFDAVSLDDLCERGEAIGVRRRPPRRYVYSI
jgi:Rrf2 family protein